jgi:hypothetical protein
MKTDRLIDMLAKGVEPAQKPAWKRRFALTIAAGLCVAIAMIVIGAGVRTDIGAALAPVLMKAGFAAAAAAIVLPLTLQLMRPGRPLGGRILAIGAFVALAALIAFVALMGADPAERMRLLMGGSFPWCIIFIPLLATPTAAGLLWLMRAFAPTRLTMTGAAIGAFSGGVGAMAYALYCPVDSVAFVTIWYVLAIAVCAALGAIIGARLLRW